MRVVALAFMLTATMFAQASVSLPPAVKSAFEQAYPGSAIGTVSQERDNGRALFKVDSVQKGKRRVVLYDDKGTAVEVAEYLDEKELPPPVAAAMHSHPRAIYVSGAKVTRGGSVEYRLTVRGTRKTAMVAKADGTVISFQ